MFLNLIMRGDCERRNKSKDKKRDKKKHPYKRGGRFRTTKLETVKK